MSSSLWKWRLVRYGPLIVSIALLALSVVGIVAAERYTPYYIPRFG